MILHLDLDSFFASAERTVNPSLTGKPIAVGGRSDPFIFDKNTDKRKALLQNSGAFVQPLFFGNKKRKGSFSDYFKEKKRIRGIVTTASYEAREYGIKTGMSIREALNRCPGLTVLVPNYFLYHTLSHDLKLYLDSMIPSVEQYSIDEFFTDISGWVDENDFYKFSTYIKNEIYRRFKLPISIGIANTKWIAKLATSSAKPNGIKIVHKNEVADFIKDIPIAKFPGIGKMYEKRLKNHGKRTLGDIKESKALLCSWGRAGKELYERICGLDHDKIVPRKERKSIGISRTFDPLHDRNELKRRVYILARHIIFIVARLDLYPSTIYFGIKYEYNIKSKKQKTFNRLFNESFLKNEALELFNELDIYKQSKIIRLSISLSNFINHKNHTYSLIHFQNDKKQKNLLQKTHILREKYGIDIIKNGIEF